MIFHPLTRYDLNADINAGLLINKGLCLSLRYYFLQKLKSHCHDQLHQHKRSIFNIFLIPKRYLTEVGEKS